MISLDQYLFRKYSKKDYNCLHFARDIWKDLTGIDLADNLGEVFAQDRTVSRKVFKSFTKLDKPSDPCIVLMSGPKVPPHIGVYVRGKILHITESGVQFAPPNVATIGFAKIRYYV